MYSVCHMQVDISLTLRGRDLPLATDLQTANK